ncbi:MAG: hypothetical protein HZC28_03640 [Spirochaetes bacterium]|nr:hypothetical protein [Spirochaetota bacterium]
MKVRHLRFLFCLIFMGVPVFPLAVISSVSDAYSIGRQLMLLEDTNASLNIDDILSGKQDARFTQSRSDVPRFGYTHSAIWARTDISNTTKQTAFVLEIPRPMIDTISVYVANGTKLIAMKQGGCYFPFSIREYPDPNPAFGIAIPPGATVTLVVRLYSINSLQAPMKLWYEQAYVEHISTRKLLWGLYFGIMGMAVVISIMLLFITRRWDYIVFSFFPSFLIVIPLLIEGIAFQYLHPSIPAFITYGLPPALAAVGSALSLFALFYYRTPQKNRLREIILVGLCAINVLTALLQIVIDYRIAARIAIITLVVTALAVFVYAVWMLVARGNARSRFFIGGWAGLMLGTIGAVVGRNGVLPDNGVTEVMPWVGAGVLLIFLFLILNDRMAYLIRVKLETATNLSDTLDVYARFVPVEFLSQLGKKKITEIKFGDHALTEMAVLFTDIRSFTKISEAMTPDEVFRFINSYLTSVGPHIRHNNGFIDKYIGDAVMALFPRSSNDAITAAITMQQEINWFNKLRAGKNLPPIAVGMGIHFGQLMLGVVGEHKRMDTTVLSDAVNLASRIEKLNKKYSSRILVSYPAIMQLKSSTAFTYRFVDYVRVIGKEHPVRIFEILAEGLDATVSLKIKTKREFEAGVAAFFSKHFTAAHEHLARVLVECPDDTVAARYYQRTQEHMDRELPAEWTGIEIQE